MPFHHARDGDNRQTQATDRFSLQAGSGSLRCLFIRFVCDFISRNFDLLLHRGKRIRRASPSAQRAGRSLLVGDAAASPSGSCRRLPRSAGKTRPAGGVSVDFPDRFAFRRTRYSSSASMLGEPTFDVTECHQRG